MQTRIYPARMMCITVSMLGLFVFFTKEAFPQIPGAQLANTASPELIGALTKGLSITPTQASGGAGALFSLAKSRLSPGDFSKVAASVPGINSLMKSAPASPLPKGIPGVSGLGGVGGLASVAGSFQKLGLSPDMAGKFVPILTQFVGGKGGSGVASLLAGALK